MTKTVESHLSRTRDIAAAKAFFRKALQRHGQPRTITLDGFEPTHSALRRMGMRNEFNFRWENPVRIRLQHFRSRRVIAQKKEVCPGPGAPPVCNRTVSTALFT